MTDRRAFVGTLASVLALSIPREGAAQSAPPSSPVPSPSPAPPSDAAMALARGMRRFDAKLTDDDVAKIAADYDRGRALGKNLQSKNAPLTNADAPVTEFIVRELP